MDSYLTITLEQELTLAMFSREIDQASSEQLKEILKENLRQTMVKDNLIKELLRKGA